MSSVQANKAIRKELKCLTEELRALSAIYGVLFQFVSEDLRIRIKAEATEFIRSNFAESSIESFWLRYANRAFRTTLEYDVTEIVKPMVSR
jgi:hypothetical protein